MPRRLCSVAALCRSATTKLITPTNARAQFAYEQYETPQGMESVYINFQNPEDWSQQVTDNLYNGTTLELRKAGLRVIEDTT